MLHWGNIINNKKIQKSGVQKKDKKMRLAIQGVVYGGDSNLLHAMLT